MSADFLKASRSLPITTRTTSRLVGTNAGVPSLAASDGDGRAGRAAAPLGRRDVQVCAPHAIFSAGKRRFWVSADHSAEQARRCGRAAGAATTGIGERTVAVDELAGFRGLRQPRRTIGDKGLNPEPSPPPWGAAEAEAADANQGVLLHTEDFCGAPDQAFWVEITGPVPRNTDARQIHRTHCYCGTSA